MKKESNLLNPYRYEFKEELEGYIFETENKVRYLAYFVDYRAWFGVKYQEAPIYTFGIDIQGDRDTYPDYIPIDSRVRDTICEILLTFFNKSDENVVVAVFDSIDQKQEQRLRKFSSWYSKTNPGYIEKHDFNDYIDETKVTASIFIHSSNPHKEDLLSLFVTLAKGNFVPLD